MRSRQPVDATTNLPKVDRGQDLQELGYHALEGALLGGFLVREERKSDKGVDGTIELVRDGHATDMRCQFQLKSTEKKKENRDRSISHSIDRSNINYLLNGGHGLYVLYVEQTHELRYLWAKDARRYLESSDPNWLTKAGEVTLRFRRKLSPEALPDIRKQIEQEAEFNRTSREILDKFDQSSPALLPVIPGTLTTIDPHELADLLEAAGVGLIASGEVTKVMDALSIIGPPRSNSPKLKLVAASGHYCQGRYAQVQADIAEVMLNRSSLNENEIEQLDFLKVASSYQLGYITYQTYRDQLAEQASAAEGLTALQYRLEALRHRLFGLEKVTDAEAFIQDIHQTVTAINEYTNAPEHMKLSASIMLLYTEGARLGFQYCHTIQIARAQHAMARAIDADAIAGVLRAYEEWRLRISDLIDRAQVADLPLALAEGLYTRSYILAGHVMNTLFASPSDAALVPVDMIQPLVGDLRDAQTIFRSQGAIQSEVRAATALAEVYSLAGLGEEARAIADEMLPKAEAMGYRNLAEIAKSHLSGSGMFILALNNLRERLNSDEDYYLAEDSDDNLHQAAMFTLEALRLPEERLPVLYREMLSRRDSARERLSHCRHLELLQSLAHERDPRTHYAIDPDRHCRCARYGYETAIGSSHWPTVIKAFKATRCVTCPTRSPKRPDTGQGTDRDHQSLS